MTWLLIFWEEKRIKRNGSRIRMKRKENRIWGHRMKIKLIITPL